MNIIFQNTKSKASQREETIWTFPLILDGPKTKNFQSLGFEIVFYIDSGADTNIINIHSWIEIHSLHPKHPLSKRSNKPATARYEVHTYN